MQMVSKLEYVLKTWKNTKKILFLWKYARYLEMLYVCDAKYFFAKTFFLCAKSDDSLFLAFSTFIAY